MGNRTFFMWDFNPADYKFPAFGKLMNIVTKSYPYIRGMLSEFIEIKPQRETHRIGKRIVSAGS